MYRMIRFFENYAKLNSTDQRYVDRRHSYLRNQESGCPWEEGEGLMTEGTWKVLEYRQCSVF